MEEVEVYHTRRLTIPSMEEILGVELKVLDHGFVRVIDYMGGDESIVQAARVSYGRGTKKWSQDRGLIRYLMRHRHTTPFEMCELKLHVKLPIFVARQWIRHRTANVNEYSARYSILDNEFYVPDREYLEAAIQGAAGSEVSVKAGENAQKPLSDSQAGRLRATAGQSSVNKQGRGETVSEDEAIESLKTIHDVSELAYRRYLDLLNEDEEGKKKKPDQKGLARELARIILPTNFYTQWYWKIDLWNLLHFISLRADLHAQYEIREYAKLIGEIVKRWVPYTWEAFEDYRQHGSSLSKQEMDLIKILISGGSPSKEESSLSDREWNEFMDKFDLDDLRGECHK